jgi:hypothetical protein
LKLLLTYIKCTNPWKSLNCILNKSFKATEIYTMNDITKIFGMSKLCFTISDIRRNLIIYAACFILLCYNSVTTKLDID